METKEQYLLEAKNLSSRQVEILKHAVGYGSKSPGYRNQDRKSVV